MGSAGKVQKATTTNFLTDPNFHARMIIRCFSVARTLGHAVGLELVFQDHRPEADCGPLTRRREERKLDGVE